MGHRPQPVLHFLSTPSVTSPRSGVFPTEWGHRGLGGAGRKRGALAVPSLQQQGPPVPSLGPASLPVFRGGAPTQTPPPQQLECPGRRVGLHQDPYPQHSGWGHGPSWSRCPFSCRHHGHLPVGGLQPPGAARAGPVRHHLAGPASHGPSHPCCPLRPLLRIPVSGPPRGRPDHRLVSADPWTGCQAP